MRTVFWEDGRLKLIDQRRLPAVLEVVSFGAYRDVARAIAEMVVRGAPAIGAAAGFALALAAEESRATSAHQLRAELHQAASVLKSARPTAANLAWAVNRILERTASAEMTTGQLKQAVLKEAQALADEDVEVNRRMARFGASLISDGDTVIHHCNTGALAAVDWGTALGAIRMAHEQGKHVHVLVDETRPRLQGSRLTAWELEQYRIPYEIITDSMAGHFLMSGLAGKVFFGADRIAANGDVANKIGTYMLALAASDSGRPAYSVAPTSTVDLSAPDGSHIPIEERDASEVLEIQFKGERAAPKQAQARNPAFDVTPSRLITAIVTENGIVYPPFTANLPGFILP